MAIVLLARIGQKATSEFRKISRRYIDMQSNQESRKYMRHEVIDFALVTASCSTTPISALIIDVGLGGLALRSKDNLQEKESITITVGQEGGEPISFNGEVRYCEKRNSETIFSVGVQFKPASHEERTLIANFINNSFQRSSQPNLAV